MNQISMKPVVPIIKVANIDPRCDHCKYWLEGKITGRTGICKHPDNDGWVTERDNLCLVFEKKEN